MPAPLISRVFSLCYQYEGQIGEKPKALYVGQKESEELDEQMRALATEANETPVARRELNGIPVYKVDAETYLACG